MKLTTEQQFALSKYQLLVKKLPREDLEKYFIDLMKQSFFKDNFFKTFGCARVSEDITTNNENRL